MNKADLKRLEEIKTNTPARYVDVWWLIEMVEERGADIEKLKAEVERLSVGKT